MKKFLSLLDKNKRFFLLTLLVGIVYSAISVAIPTISGRLITSVVADSANRTRLLCIFLLISLFQLCFAELDVLYCICKCFMECSSFSSARMGR